jgi:serine/threonine protein kinase
MKSKRKEPAFVLYEKKQKEGGKKEHAHSETLRTLSINLTSYYSKCTSEFKYKAGTAPRRVLTKVADGIHNGGYDNIEHDYICRVNDVIENPDGIQYEIAERLGHGTFGQVLKCQVANKEAVAVKIIKNKPAYFHQAIVEVKVLQTLNQRADADGQNHIVRMLDFFVYRRHLCIVFELLSVNLYEVLKQNQFRGLSTTLIRTLMEQLLKALGVLRRAKVIHCDVKPENVLLSTTRTTQIKLIDFGSACFEQYTVYTYIQSRFYRSPEVLIGLPYTSAIDMWSLGCIAAELYLGLPIFPGTSEFDQMTRIVEVLGNPPKGMLQTGRSTRKFFRLVEEGEEREEEEDREDAKQVSPRRQAASNVSSTGTPQAYDLEDFESASATTGSVMGEPWAELDDMQAAGKHRPGLPQSNAGVPPTGSVKVKARAESGYKLKSKEEYERETHKTEQASKKYVRFTSLEEMLEQVSLKPGPKYGEEQNRRKSFLHFLRGVLQFEPVLRWSPEQAQTHPFIRGVTFDPDFTPNEPEQPDCLAVPSLGPDVLRLASANSQGTPTGSARGVITQGSDTPAGHSSAPGSRRTSPSAKVAPDALFEVELTA